MIQNQSKKVLFFDDDYESMRDLKEHLEETLKWQVELTANMKIIERLSKERFDLIVVDLMIHPVSLDANREEVQNIHFEGIPWLRTGLEFLKRLRRGEFSKEIGRGTPSDVPVIILSAVGYSVEDELEGEILVAVHMEKPFRLDDMVKQICNLLYEE
jgi:CheY-like chemotaxis protein